MTLNVEPSLEVIFSHLERLKLPIAKKRRAGMSPDIVQEKISALSLSAPSDLVGLYSHADGTETVIGDILGDIWVFPGYYWKNLDKVIETYNALKKDTRWSEAWLPIFGNGGGDFYAVVCDPDSIDFGAIVKFFIHEEEQLVEFQSLGTLLSVIAQSYSEGAFSLGPNGRLVADYPGMRSIAEGLQPGFEVHSAAQ